MVFGTCILDRSNSLLRSARTKPLGEASLSSVSTTADYLIDGLVGSALEGMLYEAKLPHADHLFKITAYLSKRAKRGHIPKLGSIHTPPNQWCERKQHPQKC